MPQSTPTSSCCSRQSPGRWAFVRISLEPLQADWLGWIRYLVHPCNNSARLLGGFPIRQASQFRQARHPATVWPLVESKIPVPAVVKGALAGAGARASAAQKLKSLPPFATSKGWVVVRVEGDPGVILLPNRASGQGGWNGAGRGATNDKTARNARRPNRTRAPA